MKITVSRIYVVPDEENCRKCNGYLVGCRCAYFLTRNDRFRLIYRCKPCPACLDAREEARRKK